MSDGRCSSCHAPFAGAATSPGTTVFADVETTARTGDATQFVRPDAGADARTGGGPLRIGQRFGERYRIRKLLGVGGMGAVYEAWDAELGVTVALKVIRVDQRGGTASPEREKRFKNELLLARQVTHKHVVRIHDLGTVDGIKYITMPYVDGENLAQVLRREGRLPLARALALARQVAAGLAAAHEAGIVHRDLKPANIMIARAGDDLHAQVMDFGVSASSTDAAAGGIVGTFEYMAPEQAEGRAVDARADVYAFGLILFEMLAGPRPRAAGQDRYEAMQQRVREGLPRVGSVEPTVPATVEQIVARCLEHDQEARYANAAELAAALARVDDNGALIPEPRRLTKSMMAAVAAVVVAMLGATYYFARPAPQVHRDPVPVLIADFDNRANDPVFTGSLEQALALALEGSPYITVFKTSDARAIATQLSPEKSGRITEETGQLIARREGVKVLLAGAIDARPQGFHLALRASDPATAKPITTVEQDVADKGKVLATVGSLAAKLRRALGDSNTEMAKLAAAETFTSGSLDAMRAYTRGQELSRANRIDEALQAYQEAVRLDPQFGRAYAGMGSIYSNYFKQPDKAEVNYQLALKYIDRMTEREKYRTLGTYYMNVAGNYEKAIENYETLVKAYPADDVGHGNLALAYLHVGDVPRALAEERIALAIYPKNSIQRYNYAMYAMYAGDFAISAAEAERLLTDNPSFDYAYLPLALSRLAQGDVAGARSAYSDLGGKSRVGASQSTLGLADLEMYFGRHRKAIDLLRDGIAADAKQSSSARVSHKSAALAEAYLAVGNRRQAAAAATDAVNAAKRESTMFPAARVLVAAGESGRAATIARDLDNMLQRQTSAYARLISGEIAAADGRIGEAIEAFRNAQKQHNSWFGRYLLGKAYVEAGHFAEGHAELEICLKRRGETADVFFYDMPTLRYLPPTYYWLARSKEGIGATAEARRLYEQFLALRSDAEPPDPLAADARKRIEKL